MIKFILERYSNPHGSEQQQQMKTSKASQNPQQNASTVALKNLKRTEDHVDAMKRRLSVLIIRDQKNQNRLKQNQRKLEFHSRIQQQIAKQKRRKLKHSQNLNSLLEETRQKINSFRNQRSDNLKASKEDLLDTRRQQYQKIKKQTQMHQKSIEKMKIQSIHTNVQRKKAISQMEKLQKQHIQQYFFSKKSNFRQSSVREGKNYESRISEREKLLQDLAARQSQMIQRQSSSRAALEQSSKRLHKITPVLKPIKRQKSTSDFSSQMHPTQSKNNQQYVFL